MVAKITAIETPRDRCRVASLLFFAIAWRLCCEGTAVMGVLLRSLYGSVLARNEEFSKIAVIKFFLQFSKKKKSYL